MWAGSWCTCIRGVKNQSDLIKRRIVLNSNESQIHEMKRIAFTLILGLAFAVQVNAQNFTFIG